MGWYQGGTAASPEVYTNKIAFCGQSSGSGTIDVTISLNPAHYEFWENVDSSGHRIVFTASDGVTSLDWARTAWDHTNRTATLEVDAVSLGTTASAVHVIYCYVGNSDSGDLATSPTISSAVTFRAVGMAPNSLITIPIAPPNTTAPTVQVQKTANEQKTVWVDVRSLLASTQPQARFNGRRNWEDIAYVILNVLSSGTDTPAIYDNGKIRVWRNMVRIYLQAGSSGTTYTISLRVATATPLEPSNSTSAPTRILDLRALLVVEDIDES